MKVTVEYDISPDEFKELMSVKQTIEPNEYWDMWAKGFANMMEQSTRHMKTTMGMPDVEMADRKE